MAGIYKRSRIFPAKIEAVGAPALYEIITLKTKRHTMDILH
jgi:hypothetical protein